MPPHLGLGDILILKAGGNYISGLGHDKLFVVVGRGLSEPSSILHLGYHVIERI